MEDPSPEPANTTTLDTPPSHKEEPLRASSNVGGAISSQIYPLLPNLAKAQPRCAVTEPNLGQGGKDDRLELLRPHHPIIVVAGPTATGKSDLAQAIAAQIGGEVVSADSMQVYRGMDIGTAKLPACERIVPHHLIDVCDPGDPYSAALFQRDARSAFADIFARGRIPVLAGGTGFYVRAAIDAYEFPAGAQTSNPVREKYTRYLREHGADALWQALRDADPASAAAIHPNNTKRVIRAFELLAEGKTYAGQLQNLASIAPAYDTIFIGLNCERDNLCQRIDSRVDKMREQGLEGEVSSLLNAGFRDAVCAPQAIGYKEIVAAFDGRCTIDDAFVQIKTATKRYAKRQRSWFRHENRARWLDATNTSKDKLLNDALQIIYECKDI